LKRVIADETLEVDSFKGALQKIEAGHRENSADKEISEAWLGRTQARSIGHPFVSSRSDLALPQKIAPGRKSSDPRYALLGAFEFLTHASERIPSCETFV
jgi:hypothetical protein